MTGPPDGAALDRKADRIVGGASLVFGLLAMLPGAITLIDMIGGDFGLIVTRPLICALVVGLPAVIYGASKLLRR